MLFLNILSLVYTTISFNVYSLYNRQKNETLLYVDIHDIIGHNLKITAVNPETKLTKEFKNENVERYIILNHLHLIGHSSFMYSAKKYKHGFFAVIGSEMIANAELELSFVLFNYKFCHTIQMNKIEHLNLVTTASKFHNNYFDELARKFSDVCLKIERIERNCNNLFKVFEKDKDLILKDKLNSLYLLIEYWKIKIDNSYQTAMNIIYLVYRTKQNEALIKDFEYIYKDIKYTNEEYQKCLSHYKYIICYILKTGEQLDDSYITFLGDLKENDQNILVKDSAQEEKSQKVESCIFSSDIKQLTTKDNTILVKTIKENKVSGITYEGNKSSIKTKEDKGKNKEAERESISKNNCKCNKKEAERESISKNNCKCNKKEAERDSISKNNCKCNEERESISKNNCKCNEERESISKNTRKFFHEPCNFIYVIASIFLGFILVAKLQRK
jgi:hypothetical protein